MNPKKRYHDLFLLIGIYSIITLIIFSIYLYPAVENKRFGVSYMTMNNPFYEVINNEMRKQIEARGDVLIARDPLLSVEKQKEQIEQFIEQEVDGIFINPVDSKKIESTLKKAQEHGIPVIAIDVPLSDSSSLVSTIVSDNYDAGVQIANDLMKKKESANILLLEHSTVQSASDRIDGFKDTIRSDPRFVILDEAECQGQLELAMPATIELIENNPEADVIIALNDPSALGAKAALKALEKDSVQIYGVDGTPEMKQLIGTDPSIVGTVAQSPYSIGNRAVELMYSYLHGDLVDQNVIIPVELIDKEKIKSIKTLGWQ